MSVSIAHAPCDELLLTRETPVQRCRVRAAWLFLTPMLLCLALVAAWPLLRTFWFSLTDANLADTAGGTFVGLSNYLFQQEQYNLLRLRKFQMYCLPILEQGN